MKVKHIREARDRNFNKGERSIKPQRGRGRGRFFLLGVLLIGLLSVSRPASAHNGPPFPIITDQPVGPCVISVWADPNVGVGTFFVIVNPPSGGSIPADLTVQVGVQPVSGRLAEAVYDADRDNLRGQVQYKAVIPFDAQEFWKIHVSLRSSAGNGETTTTVEVTPVGLGRWDMLFYLSPFLAVGLLWLVAVVRKRSWRKTSTQGMVDRAGTAG
ncbi:MAG TPA: hypothetical protein VI756_24485 [Blastocatellia bacterium]